MRRLTKTRFSSLHPSPVIHPLGKTFFLSPVFHCMKNSRWRLNFLRCERSLEKISPALQATVIAAKRTSADEQEIANLHNFRKRGQPREVYPNFRNVVKWQGNFQGKASENSEIVEFLKSEPFNRKFWKFRDENQMERKFPGKCVRNLGIPHEVVLFFSEILQISNFLFSACFFGRYISQRVRRLPRG